MTATIAELVNAAAAEFFVAPPAEGDAIATCLGILIDDLRSKRIEVATLAKIAKRQEERADYAWRNARVIEAARQEERRLREEAQAAISELRKSMQKVSG